jgi:hypothetical protein
MKDLLHENNLANFAATAQEEAENINAQTNADYVTDQAFWEKQGIFTGEELAISLLGQTYSDLHKELRGRRPKRTDLVSVEALEAAINELDQEYELAQQEPGTSQVSNSYEQERESLSDLVPIESDFEAAAKHSGMGRRTEGVKGTIRITVNDLEKIINEAIDGHPYDGRIEDLAAIHGSKWAHGAVVDPQGWDDSCKLGAQFTVGKAPSIFKNIKKNMTEGSLRTLIRSVLKEKWSTCAYDISEGKNISRLRRDIKSIIILEIAGLDVSGLDIGSATGGAESSATDTASTESDSKSDASSAESDTSAAESC